jgi:hypothetical protein
LSRLSNLIAKGWEALAEAAGRGGAGRRGARGGGQDTAVPELPSAAVRLDAARDRLRASISSPSDDPSTTFADPPDDGG